VCRGSRQNAKSAGFDDGCSISIHLPFSPFSRSHSLDQPSTSESGPIDAPKAVSDVRVEPLPLPPGFVWDDCDVTSEGVLDEVHDLLVHHYVEDDDNMFRFAYSRPFLRWALMAPGYRTSWMCGVRAASDADGKKGKLLAFISAIPLGVRVTDIEVNMVEINFLCVHKKLRSKRLAPVLIKEITRRVNLCGIWQAVYTAGVLLPKPMAKCTYWHRPLDIQKLIKVKFSQPNPRRTMARAIKLYQVPSAPTVEGLREMKPEDVDVVTSMLREYLVRFKLAPRLTEEDVRHWLVHQEGVVSSYVVEDPQTKELTDFLSFYTLPSTVIGNPEYSEMKAAYMFYMVPGKHSVEELTRQLLILAKRSGHDVVNALDLLDNTTEMFEKLKFGQGDGTLHYYLYNWRVGHELMPKEVGLIML